MVDHAVGKIRGQRENGGLLAQRTQPTLAGRAFAFRDRGGVALSWPGSCSANPVGRFGQVKVPWIVSGSGLRIDGRTGRRGRGSVSHWGLQGYLVQVAVLCGRGTAASILGRSSRAWARAGCGQGSVPRPCQAHAIGWSRHGCAPLRQCAAAWVRLCKEPPNRNGHGNNNQSSEQGHLDHAPVLGRA